MSTLVLAVLCALCCEMSTAWPEPAGISPGKHADVAGLTYHVSVRRGGEHACSGALVHDSWVITAASCVYDSGVPRISVKLGGGNLVRLPWEARPTANVTKIVVHHTFNEHLLVNNIALLKIKVAAVSSKASPRLLPILLPGSENYNLRDGSVLLVSGWKKHKEEGFESQLSVTGAQLVNQRTCIRSMPSYKAVSAKMLCAGYPNAGATCQGDVGAPLVNDDVLVGVLSAGEGCSSGEYPGIYTRVSSFLPWISKIISLDLNNQEDRRP